MLVELAKYKSSKSNLFTGRPQGKQVRDLLELDKKEKSEKEITFLIPGDINGFNPSFYLGLFFQSYKNLGVEGFEKLFKFIIDSDNQDLVKIINKDLADGRRNAINSLDGTSIFGKFIM